MSYSIAVWRWRSVCHRALFRIKGSLNVEGCGSDLLLCSKLAMMPEIGQLCGKIHTFV
jgi:hypothetical protein